MKKISILLLCFAAAAAVAFFTASTLTAEGTDGAKDKFDNKSNEIQSEKNESEFLGSFIVYINDERKESFNSYEEALEFAADKDFSSIREVGKRDIIWDNSPQFVVYDENNNETEYYSYAEAYSYAKEKTAAFIYYKKNLALVWTNTTEPAASSKIENVPFINQEPELPRGCEVTSLCMLLNFNGISVTKEALAEKITKVPFSYEREGKIFSGDPNKGFVGDMYEIKNNGLGVYHRPIYNLLTEYLEDSAIDITGSDFSAVRYFLENKIPVWVITNTSYSRLSDKEFLDWETEGGKISVTYREHSVLVTGYDENYIYFNDPLNKRGFAETEGFVAAWEQMGRQAVTVSDLK